MKVMPAWPSLILLLLLLLLFLGSDGDAAAVVVSQAFSLATADASSGEHVPPLRAVTLTVLSNYGNRNCTCFYRVRILGVLF